MRRGDWKDLALCATLPFLVLLVLAVGFLQQALWKLGPYLRRV